MVERVDEPVEVIASFGRGPRDTARVVPHFVNWRGRRYPLSKLGLRHPERRGRLLVHIFTLSSAGLAFRLEFDSERLVWQLMEVSDGLPD